MTIIKFYRKNNNYVALECSGHTGYAEYNKDVLCATISGIVQSCVIGLTDVVKINPKIIKDNKRGYIKFELPNSIEQDKLKSSQVLLNTVFLSLKDLCKGYSQYISMEVIDNEN